MLVSIPLAIYPFQMLLICSSKFKYIIINIESNSTSKYSTFMEEAKSDISIVQKDMLILSMRNYHISSNNCNRTEHSDSLFIIEQQ